MPDIERVYREKYLSYCKHVYHKFRVSVHSAEDIVQEGFTKAVKLQDTFDPQRGKLETWIHMIITTTAINHHRKNKKYSANLGIIINKEIYSYDTLEEEIVSKDLASRVQKDIETLDPYRQLVMNLWLEGEYPTKIAMDLGVPRHRVRRELEKTFSEWRKLYKVVPHNFI